jgi:hypothetical protein
MELGCASIAIRPQEKYILQQTIQKIHLSFYLMGRLGNIQYWKDPK